MLDGLGMAPGKKRRMTFADWNQVPAVRLSFLGFP